MTEEDPHARTEVTRRLRGGGYAAAVTRRRLRGGYAAAVTPPPFVRILLTHAARGVVLRVPSSTWSRR